MRIFLRNYKSKNNKEIIRDIRINRFIQLSEKKRLSKRTNLFKSM